MILETIQASLCVFIEELEFCAKLNKLSAFGICSLLIEQGYQKFINASIYF